MRELIRRLSFSDRVSDGSGGVPRGCVPVLVVGDGDEECERFLYTIYTISYVISTFVSDQPTMRELIRRLSFSDRVSDGSGGVPRGCVPVLVVGDGDEECERFVVRVEALRHPSLSALLEMAAQEFGYKQEGILRVPCAVNQFRQALTTAVVSKNY
ncbi:hypothetical protein VPH35_139645 [Triticum aestivum]